MWIIKLLLLLIISIILGIYIICYCKSKFTNIKEYDLYTKLDNYRLGDIYNGNGHTSHKHHIKNFPNSIATEYILKSNNKKNNIKLLLEIIKNKTNNSMIKNNNCIVHLRVGDVLDSFGGLSKHYGKRITFNNVQDKWLNNKPNDNSSFIGHDNIKKHTSMYYLYSRDYYLNKIKKLKQLNIKNVIIIAGAHVKCKNYNNSTYYINEVKKLFEDNGITVELRLGKGPDEDVILVHNSKYFISGKGGYSRLLKEVTENSGNLII